MARRSKQQILDDNAKVLNNKIVTLNILNSHLNKVSSISDNDWNKINYFLNLFFRCETVYKSLYSGMKRIRDDEQINVRELKFNIQKFEASLRFFGIEYDHEMMKKMFGSQKSYLTYRDKIVHGLDIATINTVLANHSEMVANMEEFLTGVSEAKPGIN